MKRVTLNSVKKNNETSVSNVFLDTYMRDANGEFVKVYLYLLRCMGMDNADVTISDIADKLNLTEKDVLRALKYWAKTRVIDVVFDNESGDPSSITFLPLNGSSAIEATVSETAASSESDNSAVSEPKKPSKPSYSPAKIKQLREQEDIKQLLYIVEEYIGKPLTSTEMGTILYIYTDLGFSSDLIEYLVEYCVSNNHRSMHYIEKVALNWHDEAIDTVDKAKEIAKIKNSRTLVVTRSFGLGNRNITPAEMEFINRWYDEYGFDKELVEEACKRTIISMNKPNFSYADGILKKWRSAHIQTMDDLKTLDAGFRAKITIPVSTKSAAAQTATNRFNNFSQRTYNFDELEKKLVSNK